MSCIFFLISYLVLMISDELKRLVARGIVFTIFAQERMISSSLDLRLFIFLKMIEPAMVIFLKV